MKKSDAIEVSPAAAMQRISTDCVAGHVEAIRQIQKQVMKEGVHYGTIPGTDKPSLWKAGAEIVMMTFRVFLSDVQIEDLSTEDCIRYRVKTIGSGADGIILGIGIGEASSYEDKYCWRKATTDAEWDATPASRRREKYKKGKKGRSDYTVKQVRTNPADQANTVLKMAKKRSYTDLALTATAASEVFTQDIEEADGEKKKPKPKPQSRPRSGSLAGSFKNGELCQDGRIDQVAVEKEGVKGDGTPWTLFGVYIAGEAHKTFSASVYERAQAAHEAGLDVSILYTVGQYGRDLEELIVHDDQPPDGPPPPDDDDMPPDFGARGPQPQEE
jgi:hypothetical protein